MVKFTIDKNKENPYVMLNKTPLSDSRISWRAKGIWAYLLSKPDNWTVREKDLMNKSTEGRDAVRGAIKELVDNGYILKTELREKGKYVGVEYSVFESPITTDNTPVPPSPKKPSTATPAVPLPGKPSTDKPMTANPLHSNKGLLVSTDIIINETTTSKAAPQDAVAPILNNTGKEIILPAGITQQLLVDLAIKYVPHHGADIVDRQLINLKHAQARGIIERPAAWLTNACKKNYPSAENINLFAVQENTELESRLVQKLNTDSSSPHELADQDFKAMLGKRPKWFLDMIAGAGV